MKVIFLENVNKVGKKFEVKDVATGYAINFLFPKNLAVVYNDNNLKLIETNKKREIKDNNTSEIDKLKNIKEISIRFKEKISPAGKLFAQIKKDKIVGKILQEYKIKLKSEDLIIDKPLKELGNYTLGIKPNLDTVIKIIIEKDEKD
jgi:large subunit ribosomal protein L9